MFAPQDMTEGKPYKKIMLFTIPMLIGNMAQQLYATVDSIVVGNQVGDNALAAVGSAGPIFNLLLVLFMGISVGAGILVSQHFGAKSKEDLSYVVGSCITLTLIASLIIMAITPFIVRPLLELLNTPDSIIEWSNDYLVIMMLGVAGLAFYNILSGVLRGLGDSLSALLYLLIATILNIVLDLYFVITLDMGVAGVAYATVIAQSVSAVLCLRKIFKMKDVFVLEKKHLLLTKNHTLDIVRLGVPSGLTQAIFSMALVMVQSLSNTFGETFISANVIVMRVDGFAVMPTFSFAAALTTFVGQNTGAKKYDRVYLGAKQGVLLSLVTSAAITILILATGDELMGMFTKTEELIDMSMRLMWILAPGYLAMAIMQSLYGVMRGAGDTVTPMWISIISNVIIRVPLAYGLSFLTRTTELPTGRSEVIYISLLCAWVLGAIMTMVAYKKGRWRKLLIS